jgi:hypothetical protein
MRKYLNNLLDGSKSPRTGGMDSPKTPEEGITNTTKNNKGTNFPEDGGVSKKR